jgi:hypothetical protein
MKLIISGGRNYVPKFEDRKIIASVVQRFGVTEILSGGSPGADAMGERYARCNGIPVGVFPADWSRYGKRAGPIRNERMALRADIVLLFPGDSETADMKKKASFYKLKIIESEDIRGEIK